jgi:ABC-2 type transport system permease protein
MTLRERIERIVRFRELLVGLVRKELKVRYKNSVLGFAWSLLNPLMILVVYYFAFSVIIGTSIPRFPVYLLTGVLVWNLFSSGLAGATSSVVTNSALVKKVAFPREILPMASVGAALVHFFLQGIVLFGALFAFHHAPAWPYLVLLIPATIAVLTFTVALGVLLSAVNAYLRDTQHFLELALVAWFWFTPIVYNWSLVERHLHRTWFKVLYLGNPLTPVVLTFQRAIYNVVSFRAHDPVTKKVVENPVLPTWSILHFLGMIGISFGISIVLLLFAVRVFGRLEGNLAEEL